MSEKENFLTEEEVRNSLNLHNVNELNSFCLSIQNLKFTVKIFLLISNEGKDRILDIFSKTFVINKQDDFYKVELISREFLSPLFLGYLYFYPNQITPMFFSFRPIKELKKYFVRPFISKNPGIQSLWITHRLMMNAVEYVENQYSATICHYIGEYIPSLKHKARLRPEFQKKLEYRGLDCSEVIKEANDMYGINVDKFSFMLLGQSYIDFDRKNAVFTIKQCDLSPIFGIIDWILEQSGKYLDEIRKFRKEQYRTQFLNREYKISNNLAVNFDSNLNDEILNEIIAMIPDEFDVIDTDIDETPEYRIFHLDVFNKSKRGFFRVVLNQKFAHISQIFGGNFLGILPFLDLLDYHQPSNAIQTLGN